MKTMRLPRSMRLAAMLCALSAISCDLLNPSGDDPVNQPSDTPAGLSFEANEGGWALLSARNATGDVVIPATYKGSPVTAIEEGAFRDSSITSVVVPSSVTSMGIRVFHGCASLKSAEIRATVTRLPGSTFYGCSALERVILPDGLVEIGEHAFFSCSRLASLDLGDDLATMRARSVSGCDALVTLTLPASLTSMDHLAVLSCPNLTEVVMLGSTPPTIAADGAAIPLGISNCGRLGSIRVPSAEAVAAYRGTVGWSHYSGIITE